MLWLQHARVRWSRVRRALLFLFLAPLAGCGANEPVEKYVPVDFDAAVVGGSCVDQDNDGYGPYCDLGPDCDDGDETVTDLCFRCGLPTEGCPCEPGTLAVECVPPPYRGTDENGASGTYICSEGTRYCARGTWGPCQALAAYFFVSD